MQWTTKIVVVLIGYDEIQNEKKGTKTYTCTALLSILLNPNYYNILYSGQVQQCHRTVSNGQLHHNNGPKLRTMSMVIKRL